MVYAEWCVMVRVLKQVELSCGFLRFCVLLVVARGTLEEWRAESAAEDAWVCWGGGGMLSWMLECIGVLSCGML